MQSLIDWKLSVLCLRSTNFFPNKCPCPADNSLCDCQCLLIFFTPNSVCNPGVSSGNRETGQTLCLSDGWRNFLSCFLQRGEEFRNIVDIRELDFMGNQDSLNSLLHSLLRVEAQILQIDISLGSFCQEEVAAGSVEPFAGIFRRITCRHGRFLSLGAVLVQ